MPRTTTARASIPLPVEECWEKMRDLTAARHYVPGLTDTVITTEQKEGVGASRVVSHKQFGDMNETVTVWDEGQGFTIRLHKGDKGPAPMKAATFRYELLPTAEGCEIQTSMTYEMPWGPLGRLLDALILKNVFRRNVADTATCLAEYYRTNQPVPSDAVAGLRANAL